MADHPTCDLRYEVWFAREGAPTTAIHVICKAKGAPKPTRTLCGVPTEGLQKTMPHRVGRNRFSWSGDVAADPFFTHLGCSPCKDRFSF